MEFSAYVSSARPVSSIETSPCIPRQEYLCKNAYCRAVNAAARGTPRVATISAQPCVGVAPARAPRSHGFADRPSDGSLDCVSMTMPQRPSNPIRCDRRARCSQCRQYRCRRCLQARHVGTSQTEKCRLRTDRELARERRAKKSKEEKVPRSGLPGSNRRHQAWEACALPTELSPRASR